MLYSKKFTRIIISLFFALILIVGFTGTTAYAKEDELYLGGFPAGFVLNTTTVEVVGLCEVLTDDGIICPARESGIKSGDIIERINDKEINSTADLNNAVNSEYSKYIMYVKRHGQIFNVNVKPAIEKASKLKKLGLLVKDSVNGIGTVTYINKTKNTFGSLGHPVNDLSNRLIEINGGNIYGCLIYDVKKGVRGNPGELRGVFENNNHFALAAKNCSCGIFGNISQDFSTRNLIKIKKASVYEVRPGKAEIYSTLKGNQAKKYAISIIKVDADNKENRNFVIRIDDKELIETSGGIVQGMSGSPIVQNGKLVGAVTHVFVNDPTRGYGIAIDNMLSSY